jgi:hypothetical protein
MEDSKSKIDFKKQKAEYKQIEMRDERYADRVQEAEKDKRYKMENRG